jgi:hypothetical protein
MRKILGFLVEEGNGPAPNNRDHSAFSSGFKAQPAWTKRGVGFH